jgi:predicted amidohydrolase
MYSPNETVKNYKYTKNDKYIIKEFNMDKLKVAAVSTKNFIGEPERSIRNMSKWARKAAAKEVDLIVFPELGVNGYIQHNISWDLAECIPGPSTDKLISLSKEVNAVICFGILERDADIVYNTQVLVSDNGIIGKQRKIHMPPDEYSYWRSGFQIETFDIGKAKVGITICYDSLFSELARSLYFKGAEILIMPFAYNTSIPSSRFPEEDINALYHRSTCYSNGVYGILCNNAGNRKKNKWEPNGNQFPGWAGVFGPNGKIVSFTRQKGNGEAMSIATLEPKILENRRNNAWFVPRRLKPEIYFGIQDSDQTGKA